MEPNREFPSLITAKELARMLQVSTRTVWRLLKAGEIPKPIRIGGMVRWRLDTVHDWITGKPAL
jgi:excisionase family DNA binding protein